MAILSEIRRLAISPKSMHRSGEFTELSGMGQDGIWAERGILARMAISRQNVGCPRGAKFGHRGIVAPLYGRF